MSFIPWKAEAEWKKLSQREILTLTILFMEQKEGSFRFTTIDPGLRLFVNPSLQVD
jgi:hypothetical protein